MKKWIMTTVAMLTVLTLTACSKETTKIDIEQVSSALLEQITYTDELAEVDMETAKMLFYLEDANITAAKVYESGGATAEEIAVFECASSEDADKVLTAAQQRVAEQKESFTDYVPEELPKLDNAVVVKSGNTVILSVSGDSETAKKIIEGK